MICTVPPGVALIVTFRGSNYMYRCLKQIFMVPKGFEPSKFDCILKTESRLSRWYGVYAASKTTLLYMERLDKTESFVSSFFS